VLAAFLNVTPPRGLGTREADLLELVLLTCLQTLAVSRQTRLLGHLDATVKGSR